nr:NUDIX hydrolase [Brevibacterium otitidis]
MHAERELTRFAAELSSAGQAPQAEFLLAAGPAALSKADSGEHFTASCIVFDLAADGGQVLLQRHRKTGRWMQFGGHIEPADASFAAAAARELSEEAGLTGWRWFSPAPVEVSEYVLSAAHGSCTRHRDVLFAADVPSDAVTRRSAESHALGWFSLTELPEDLMPDLTDRLHTLWEAARTAAAS